VEDFVGREMFDRSRTSDPATPSALVDNIESINPDFKKNKQEDAHEFLISLFQRMMSAYLEAHGGVIVGSHDRLDETTLIHSVFGGYLLNRLHCCSCKNDSNTFNSFLDLSLPLEKHVESVVDALQHFTTTDDCDWVCNSCHSRIPNGATKQLLIFNTPRSFILHLKRFTFDPSSGKSVKNQRPIAFSVTLNVTPFISDDSDEKQQSVLFELYGVLVHHGQTANSGHYIAFVKCLSTGKWYCMNDAKRSEVAWEIVKEQQAYILFYSKRDPSFPAPFVPVAENAASASKNSASNLALSVTASSPSSTDSESSKDKWTAVVKKLSKAKK